MAWAPRSSRPNRSLELLSRAVPSPDELKPGYFFHGPEAFAAESFVDRAIEGLRKATGEEVEVSRCYLDETGWGEILDMVRTSSLFSAVRRVFVVRVPEKAGVIRGKKAESSRKSSGPSPEVLPGMPEGLADEDDEILDGEDIGDEDEGASRKDGSLDEFDRGDIERYFASPAPATTVFILRTGKLRADDKQVRFFSSLPGEAVEVVEVEKMKDGDISAWIGHRAAALGKVVPEHVRRQLIRAAGLNPRLISNELDKLAAFAGDRRDIKEEDVEQVTVWTRTHENYALADALLGGSFPEAAGIINDMLEEGLRPEPIVGQLTAFLRRMALADSWLSERTKSREEIFQEFFPYIKPMYSFYQEKFNRFFGCLNRLGAERLAALTEKLQQTDARIKSTETDPGILLELFLLEYFRKK